MVGEALENQFGDNPGEHAGELARHFAEASPILGTEKLVRYSLLAGEQALAICAHEQALEHFQRGLSAKAGQPNGLRRSSIDVRPRARWSGDLPDA